MDLRAHALRDKTLQLGVYRPVLGGHNVPARLRFPGRALHLLIEQIGGRSLMGSQDEPFFLGRQVSGEALDALSCHPDTTLPELRTRENLCPGKLVLLTL